MSKRTGENHPQYLADILKPEIFKGKKVTALGKLQIVLGREQALNAVVDHRALTEKNTAAARLS
jgi:hypothetical protein